MEPSSEDRLDSWKEIAAYLKRDITTVQRWERREGMPVRRHVHDKVGSVYAFRSELDAWWRSRNPPAADLTARAETTPATPAIERVPRAVGLHRLATVGWLVAAGAVVALGLTTSWLARDAETDDNPLAGARFQQLTDFGGTEQAAAISRDGTFVSFLSDRDGQIDVWVTQPGVGRFHNLTQGAAPELVNPSIRTLGFSPDGAMATFWARRPTSSSQSDISIWAVPILGGPPRPYLEGAAEFDWSDDDTRLVYHTPGPGDPMFVRDRQQEQPRKIFFAAPGLHAHFPVWSRDQSYIYFVLGIVPDRMDIWRISPSGGVPERITAHDSRVSHPVFLNARTLLYLADSPDGSGPFIFSVDVVRRTPQRVSFGVERYSSLAGSTDGRRIVATMASPKSTLWRIPMIDTRVDWSAARRISLTTGNGFAPRLGDNFLLYLTSRGDSDSIWRLQEDVAVELWSAPGARITAAPAISRDGGRIAFVSQRDRRRSLHLVDSDGTDARVLTSSLQLEGAPAWAPDGRSITIAAVVDGAPRLFIVPIDGSPPRRLVEEHSLEPVWSADGTLVVYSGADIGTMLSVKAINFNDQGSPAAEFALSRGSRHLSFLSGGPSLVVLQGEIAHKDLWLIDLETGAQRQLTDFPRDFNVRDFDISPDGREMVVEQVQEHSDIVLIDLPRR